MANRVAVVEDDPLMRLAIVTASKMAGFDVVIESGSAADAVSAAKKIQVDIAVLDLHLGDGPTGLDVAHALRRINSKVGLVILTSFEDPRLLHSSLDSIPRGTKYLTKSTIQDINTLVRAMKESLDLSETDDQVSGNLGGLTANQIRILELVAEGLSNSEIAKQKYITERSVEVAISRIAKSLGISFGASVNQRVHMAKVYFRAIGKTPN